METTNIFFGYTQVEDLYMNHPTDIAVRDAIQKKIDMINGQYVYTTFIPNLYNKILQFLFLGYSNRQLKYF
ncbi:unnamed protein product [Cunninghamella blakesleeana]